MATQPIPLTGTSHLLSRLKWISLLIALAAVPLQISIACSCHGRDICVKVEDTRFIFLGEVVEGGLEEGQDAWKGTASFAKLRVIETFRGVPADMKEVVIKLHFIPGMCAPMPYRKGHRTLVFLRTELADGLCTESELMKDDSTDLDYVRSYFLGQTKTTIRGQIASNSTAENAYYTLSSGGLGIAGARVTAQTGDKLYSSTSDSIGNYEISGLPAGTYKVGAELDGFSNRDDRFNVTLNPRGCAIRDFGLWSNNSVEGFLNRANGKPLTGLSVFLQKVGQKQKFGKERRSNAQGEFRFEEIDPGNYFLVVSPDGTTDDSPFERFVFRDVIAVTATGKVQVGPIMLPNPIATREIKVRLTWPDGSPIPNASLTCAQAEFEHTGYPKVQGIESKNGVAVCRALADRPYHIVLNRLSYTDPNVLGRLSFKALKLQDPKEAIIPPGTNDVEIHLQLSKQDFSRFSREAVR